MRAAAQPHPHPAPAGRRCWCLPWLPSVLQTGVVRQLLPETCSQWALSPSIRGFCFLPPPTLQTHQPLIPLCPEDAVSRPLPGTASSVLPVQCSDTFCRESCMSPQPSRATASLPPKQLLPRHPQTGASAPCLSVIGRPQQYETTGVSSVFAKHLPTAQSLLSLQGGVSHCLFNLTTKLSKPPPCSEQ